MAAQKRRDERNVGEVERHMHVDTWTQNETRTPENATLED